MVTDWKLDKILGTCIARSHQQLGSEKAEGSRGPTDYLQTRIPSRSLLLDKGPFHSTQTLSVEASLTWVWFHRNNRVIREIICQGYIL